MLLKQKKMVKSLISASLLKMRFKNTDAINECFIEDDQWTLIFDWLTD